MRFQIGGFRPAALWSAMALALALPVGVLMAQAQAQSSPAAAQSAAAPASAGGAAVKPGDATAGQGKAAVCGACHGVDGNSTDAQYPKLAGQSEEYIVLQLEDFKSGVRQNPIMMGMAAPLSEQD